MPPTYNGGLVRAQRVTAVNQQKDLGQCEVDLLMDTASKCPKCDRPRSSLTPQEIRYES
jgi:hypothetical protein